MFENYRDSLFNSKIIMRSQLRFKSDHHNVYTEEIDKIALNSSDNKRLQTFDGLQHILMVQVLLKYVKVK